MLKAGDEVEHVYLASFPTSKILDRIIHEGRKNSLLFIHHPIHLDAGGEGFVPIDPSHIQVLLDLGVSVYACHAPMDCNIEIGTNTSIIQATELSDVELFDEYGLGYAGRIGNITPTRFDDLVDRVKSIFEIDEPKIGGTTDRSISKVAVVAGGADDVSIMKEAESLGADAYLCGEWHSRLESSNPGNMEWSESNKKECFKYVADSSMAFIGVSHAASEYLVMERQMKPYFEELGLSTKCMKQDNWWR